MRKFGGRRICDRLTKLFIVYWSNTHSHSYTRLLLGCFYNCVSAAESKSLPKTVVTCKIKHLQKCFRAVDFPGLCRGRKNVVKMFYFTCNYLLCSTCVQHAKTFAKHLQKCFIVLFYMYPPLKHFCKCFANVLRWLHVKQESQLLLRDRATFISL